MSYFYGFDYHSSCQEIQAEAQRECGVSCAPEGALTSVRSESTLAAAVTLWRKLDLEEGR